MQDFQEQLNKKLQAIKENLAKIHRMIEEDRVNKEHLFEQKVKEIANMDLRFSQTLDN